MPIDYQSLFERLTKRYGGATPEAIESILCPLLIPIQTLDKTIIKIKGQKHHRASFTIALDSNCEDLIAPGCTGKFVSRAYKDGGVWRELAKGRILEVDVAARVAKGEIYEGAGSKKSDLDTALKTLSSADFWELDQYGASAKVLSGLVEYSLVKVLKEDSFGVRRMPADMAKHIGGYAYFDFEVSKTGVTKRLEAKSLWGTDTKRARLIHSLNPKKGYPTSSCKFATQDFFAVSLFLRSGNIRDFAFARSVPADVMPHGLPRAGKYPEHVNQNPTCEIGDGRWFRSLDEVWNLA